MPAPKAVGAKQAADSKKPKDSADSKTKKDKKKKASDELGDKVRKRIYLTGAVALFLTIAALFPGTNQEVPVNVWKDIHAFFWGIGGITLPLWIAFLFWLCYVWLSGREIKDVKTQFAGMIITFLALGGFVTLISADAKEAEPAKAIMELTATAMQNAKDKHFFNGGAIAAALAGGFLFLLTRIPSIVLFFLLLCMGVLCIFPKLRKSFYTAVKGKTDDLHGKAKAAHAQREAEGTTALDKLKKVFQKTEGGKLSVRGDAEEEYEEDSVYDRETVPAGGRTKTSGQTEDGGVYIQPVPAVGGHGVLLSRQERRAGKAETQTIPDIGQAFDDLNAELHSGQGGIYSQGLPFDDNGDVIYPARPPGGVRPPGSAPPPPHSDSPTFHRARGAVGITKNPEKEKLIGFLQDFGSADGHAPGGQADAENLSDPEAETAYTPDGFAGQLSMEIAGDPQKRTRALAAGDKARSSALAVQIEAGLLPPEAEAQYRLPPIHALNPPPPRSKRGMGVEEDFSEQIVNIIQSYGIGVEKKEPFPGPVVTQYRITPKLGVRLSKITGLANDIALWLAVDKVRIEAPIPGTNAIGVEVPNKEREMVFLREVIDSNGYRAEQKKSKLTIAIGKDIGGNLFCTDLAKIPHLLIAGTTGSGKSVCMNTLILSLLYNATPDEVKMIMIDPKQVEFAVYAGIPHLLVPVVSDSLKAAGTLSWAVNEMERRYNLLAKQCVRDIDSYNQRAAAETEAARREGRESTIEMLPKIVIFIDELSDLMMVAPSDVEDSIQRLTQKARASGIHLVIATQRPSVDVITGVIKSNLPGRIALSVASPTDSRVIINAAGAEQLLGHGDMLFVNQNGWNGAVRLQGAFVSDEEVGHVVNFIKNQGEGENAYSEEIWEEIQKNAQTAGTKRKKPDLSDADFAEDEAFDEMYQKAVQVVVEAGFCSTTNVQKRLKLGYARASRLVDRMEEQGIVGPPDGPRPRKVLVSPAQWMESQAHREEAG
ncbi:MAG: DNA translocase FtsK [Oscillospiraceae bacterium]|nr:DNA translocase FtsK [Oscillospiraceae bacterium]